MSESNQCPACGSADYWHEWTDQYRVVKAVCCQATFKVINGQPLKQLTDKDGRPLNQGGEEE